MDSVTFRSRVSELLQKSRKALRLYSSVGKLHNDKASELTESQVAEWKRVNGELSHELTHALEKTNNKAFVSEIFSVRDRFYGEWKVAEADMHRKQRMLLECSENGDFVKSSVLAQELVLLKARSQACQAAHHELNEVLTKGRVQQPPIELAQEVVELKNAQETIEEEEPKLAKVIPLRQKASG